MATNIFADLEGGEPSAPLPRRREEPKARNIFAEPEPTFDNVESSVDSTEDAAPTPEDMGLLERTLLAGQNFLATNRAGRDRSAYADALQDLRAADGSAEPGVLEERVDATTFGMDSRFPMIMPSQEARERARDTRVPQLQQALDTAREVSQTSASKAKAIETLLGPDSVAATISRVAGGVASQAEYQVLPLVGGFVGSAAGPGGAVAGAAVGSLPMAEQARRGAYLEATEWGATPEEAEDYALIMAGLEFAPSVAGGAIGGAATRLGINPANLGKTAVKRGLYNRIKGRGGRIAWAAMAEGTDEVVAGALQDVAQSTMHENEFFASLEAQAALGKQVQENEENRWRNMGERFLGGSMGGVAIGGPAAFAGYEADMRQRESDILRDINTLQEARAPREEAPTLPSPEPVASPAPAEQDVIEDVEEAAPVQEAAPEVQEEQDDPSVRKSDIGKIQYWKRQTGMSDDFYRERLQTLTGKSSSTELSPDERKLVIEDLSGKPYEAPIPKKPKAPAAPVNEEVAPIQNELNEIEKSLGLLNQESRTPMAGRAPNLHDRRVREIARSLARGNTQQDVDVANLIKQGKLKIVDNPAAAGSNRNDTAEAMYKVDTGEMFIFTENIADDAPVRVETLAAAMHEATHAGQFKGRDARSSVLNFMLGEETMRKANAKVVQAARKGNKIAQSAVMQAMDAGKSALIKPNMTQAEIDAVFNSPQFDAEIRRLEIIPYLGTEVTRARGKPLGTVAGAWTDVKSGLRSFARKTFGPNTEFDFNELMSATQRMAGEMVETDTLKVPSQAKPKTKAETLNMVAGRQATGFANAEERNRIYQGFVDGKDRFEFSDSNSAITNDPETITEYESGTPVYLGELLGHESLYEQYPEALTILVQHNPAMQPGSAMFDADRNTIEVGPQGGNDRRLRSTLLHEVQHWIQEKEGFIKGFNDDVLVDPNVKASKMEATSFVNQVVSRLDLPAAIEQLPEDLRAQWEEEGLQTADPMIQAEIFLAGVYGNAHPNGHVRNRARRYAVVNARRVEADTSYQEQMDAAWDAYIRDYGETEARNTQRRANVTQEEMDSALDPNPESEMRYANFNVPVERTQNSMALLEGKDAKPKKSGSKADNFDIKKGAAFNESDYRPEVVGWAKRIYGELEAPNGRPIWQNFVQWFGNSSVVNEDGTPRMLFHGTTAPVDFEAFHDNYDWEIGTHLGTSTQAGDPRFVGSIYSTSPWSRAAEMQKTVYGGTSSRIIPLYANFENPLHVKDAFGGGPRDVVVSIMEALGLNVNKPIDTWDKKVDPIMRVWQWMDTDRRYTNPERVEDAYSLAWPKIRDALQDMGYDSLSYQNIAEGFNFQTPQAKEQGKYAPSKGPSSDITNYYPYASDFPETSYVILEPTQVKSVNNTGNYDGRNARLLAQRARRTQTVYHGTPNTFTNTSEDAPFGAFDLSFMSSGEGQQAFGYGFYFSGSWDVSDEQYRTRLLGPETTGMSDLEEAAEFIHFETHGFEGEALTARWEELKTSMAATVEENKTKLRDMQANIEESAQQYVELVSSMNPQASPDAILKDFMTTVNYDRAQINYALNGAMNRLAIMENSTPEQIREIVSKMSEDGEDGGQLYYVEIPEDSQLANWDGHHADQPDHVKQVWDFLVGTYITDPGQASRVNRDRFRNMYRHVAEAIARENPEYDRNPRGAMGAAEAEVSAILNDLGVPGHKFAPGHQRNLIGTGKVKYYNYVVYDPSQARIIGRDAREKGQTRQEMLDWAATIAERNAAKARAWADEARSRLQGEQSDYGRILYMATRRGPHVRKARVIPGWLRSLMGSTGGTNRTIREITEHAVSSPALTRMLAENYEGQYRTAVTKEAAKRGISEAELDKRITDAVDTINPKTNSYDVNLAAFKHAVKPFGEAGRVLVEMRLMVDNISLEMLRDRAARAANGEAMSAAEKKQYATIMANLGRYGHRQYAAHVRNGGFGEAVWDSYQKAKDKKPLTAAEKDNARRVTRALKVLVDEIAIPDDAKLNSASQERIDRLYTNWVGRQNVDALSYDDKRAELAAMRDVINGDKQAMIAQAERVAEEILGLHGNETGMIADYYRGGKVDLGILQKRQKLPPEIRELMGEIKDPAMRLFITASKQAEFVARNKMLMELSRVNDPYHVQPPGPSGRSSVRGMVELKGEAFGPMNGWWVSKELNGLIRDNVEMLASFEDAVAMAAARPRKLTNKALLWAFDKWTGLAANTKMLQIIGNPTNFLFNLYGGGRMMLVNGNINPRHLAKAFSTSRQLIAYARNPAKAGDDARRVTGAGVVDSAFIGEVSTEQYRTLLSQVEKMVGREPTAKEVRTFLRKAGMSIKETYAMMDVMYKIANFYQQADAVLPAFYKAEGIQKTQQEIDREAADIVNRTNITYKRAATIVKAMERGGFTQFGTYLYEVFRTEVQNLGQGIEELARANAATTPEGRRILTMQASRRVGGQVLAWGLTAAVSKMLAELTFGDDEEDKYLRYLLPDYSRGKDFVAVGKDENGRDVMMEFSRLDPAGPATDIMRRMINLEVTPEALAEELFGLYIAPRIAGRIWAAGQQTWFDQKNVPAPIIETVWPGLYQHVLRAGSVVGMEEDTTRAWTRLLETGLPGGLNALRETNPKFVDAQGTPSAISGLTRMMGVSYVRPEPAKQMSFAASAYDDTVQNERRKIAGLARSYDTITDRDVMRKLVEARTEEFNAFKDAQNIYRGMKALGLSENQITDELKRARVSKELMRQLRSGEFKSQTISKKSFNGHRDTAIRRANSEQERQEIKKKWDEAWEIVKGVASDD